MEGTLKFLGLNKKELKVLEAIKSNFRTPLNIARQARISRPGVYHILKRLTERGIIKKGKYTQSGEWFMATAEEIEKLLQDTTQALSISTAEQDHILSDKNGSVTVYRGKKSIRRMITTLFDNHSRERVYIFQGTVARKDWEKFFSPEETNALNKLIKERGLIMDAIFPKGWIEKEIMELGSSWAIAYEGRTARTSLISPEYFTHRASLFMFKDSVYLFTLHEETAIVIKNSDIQKMLFAMFSAIGDTAETIDLNAHIRELIAKEKY